MSDAQMLASALLSARVLQEEPGSGSGAAEENAAAPRSS